MNPELLNHQKNKTLLNHSIMKPVLKFAACIFLLQYYFTSPAKKK